MWVRFTSDFDWKPKQSVTLAYKSGNTVNVVKDCAEAAIKAGAAVELHKKSKTSEPVEVKDSE